MLHLSRLDPCSHTIFQQLDWLQLWSGDACQREGKKSIESGHIDLVVRQDPDLARLFWKASLP